MLSKLLCLACIISSSMNCALVIGRMTFPSLLPRVQPWASVALQMACHTQYQPLPFAGTHCFKQAFDKCASFSLHTPLPLPGMSTANRTFWLIEEPNTHWNLPRVRNFWSYSLTTVKTYLLYPTEMPRSFLVRNPLRSSTSVPNIATCDPTRNLKGKIFQNERFIDGKLVVFKIVLVRNDT